MSVEEEYGFRAGRLIQWALQPRVRPAQVEEYRELIALYDEDRAFRSLVEDTAAGLGLHLLDVSPHGAVVAPAHDSVFRMRFTEYRPSSSSVDDRLLDGLAQVAIAATVFPRDEDLQDDVETVRPALSVEEVDRAMRSLCEALEKRESAERDPSVDEDESRLLEAWRVYRDRFAASESATGVRPRRATMTIIEYALEKLREQGCFIRTDDENRTLWQPTRRYNVMLQDFAATTLFERVRELMEVPSCQD